VHGSSHDHHAPARAARERRRPDLAARRPAPVPRGAAATGWPVVAGAFLVLMVGYGAIYSYAAFAEEIAAEFGVARASVAVIYALSGGACFFVSALSGPLADRIGARAMAAMGMLAVGLGLMVAATAGSLVEVYVGYGLLIGLGTGCAYVPALAAVQRNFDAHRGLASGIAVSGIGIGTLLVPPLADLLADLGGWRAGFVACGAMAAAVGVAGAMLLGPPPATLKEEIVTAAPLSRGFALAYAGTLLASLPAVLPHALLVSTARDMGLARQEALALLGLIGLGTIAGRFVLAALADSLGRRRVFLACCGGMALSMLVWAFAAQEAALQAFALGFGALQGGFVALLPAFVADRFGARGIGGVLGLLYTGRGIALLAAPPAVAWSFALLDGHEVPLGLVAALGVMGTLLLAAAARRQP
jgi:OFA family oxalate/formate antiporter-like MFS transporter